MKISIIAFALTSALAVSAAPKKDKHDWTVDFNLQDGSTVTKSGDHYGSCHEWKSAKEIVGAYLHQDTSKAQAVVMYSDKKCKDELKQAAFGTQQWWKDTPQAYGSWKVEK